MAEKLEVRTLKVPLQVFTTIRFRQISGQTAKAILEPHDFGSDIKIGNVPDQRIWRGVVTLSFTKKTMTVRVPYSGNASNADVVAACEADASQIFDVILTLLDEADIKDNDTIEKPREDQRQQGQQNQQQNQQRGGRQQQRGGQQQA